MQHATDNTSEVRESALGRLWLGCGTLIAIVVPAWLLISGMFIQLDPELSGFQSIVDGGAEPVTQLPTLQVWLIGGMRGAAAMAAILALFLVLWPIVGGVSAWLRRRDAAERARYDALVRDAAVLRDDDEPAS